LKGWKIRFQLRGTTKISLWLKKEGEISTYTRMVQVLKGEGGQENSVTEIILGQKVACKKFTKG